MLTTDQLAPDILRDYLEGQLSELGRQRIERAIRDDHEIARAFKMIREGTDVIRARLELDEEVPTEWLAIIAVGISGRRADREGR